MEQIDTCPVTNVKSICAKALFLTEKQFVTMNLIVHRAAPMPLKLVSSIHIKEKKTKGLDIYRYGFHFSTAKYEIANHMTKFPGPFQKGTL